jgi:glyoxylase-like metal-dependent hydrolase (beta-lactamase superfamily II)
MKNLVVALALVAAPALAQKPQEMASQKVRDNFWLLTGPGGNIALVVGADVAYLVDDQIQPMTPKLLAEIKKATDKPVRFVVNTHWHGDHAGGNQTLAESGAILVAHENVRKRLSTEQFTALFNKKHPPQPPAAWPVVTFTDGLTLHLAGDDVDVMHVPPAHTDGDSLVHWKKADVIHMGDTFVDGYPFIDRSSGGRVDGFLAAADRALALAGPKTVIIPGHGPLGDRAKLQAFRDMVKTLRDRVAQLVAARKTLAEVLTAKPSADFDEKWKSPFITPEIIVRTIYEDLTAK